MYDANNTAQDRKKLLGAYINQGMPAACSICGAPLKRAFHKSFLHLHYYRYKMTFNAYICTDCLKTAAEMAREEEKKDEK